MKQLNQQEPIIDNKTSQNEASHETEAISETVQDPSMTFATDRTDLTAVIESIDGKGLAKSLDEPRFIYSFPNSDEFHGVGIERFMIGQAELKFVTRKIHALIYPDGQVVRAEVD